jgi:hypothetical protein
MSWNSRNSYKRYERLVIHEYCRYYCSSHSHSLILFCCARSLLCRASILRESSSPSISIPTPSIILIFPLDPDIPRRRPSPRRRRVVIPPSRRRRSAVVSSSPIPIVPGSSIPIIVVVSPSRWRAPAVLIPSTGRRRRGTSIPIRPLGRWRPGIRVPSSTRRRAGQAAVPTSSSGRRRTTSARWRSGSRRGRRRIGVRV